LDQVRPQQIGDFKSFWAAIPRKLLELNSRRKFFAQIAEGNPPSSAKPVQPSSFASYSNRNSGSGGKRPHSMSKLHLSGPELLQLSQGGASEELLFFPILFLSQTDLLDMSDALLYLYASFHRNLVLIFAPDFALESLMFEIKAALDKLSNVENVSRSHPLLASTTPNTPTSLGGSSISSDRKSYIKELQQQLVHHYKKDSSPRHSQQRYPSEAKLAESLTGREKAQYQNQDITWSFEVILEVIERVEREKAVSITVFM
jgi:hypothetical protein